MAGRTLLWIGRFAVCVLAVAGVAGAQTAGPLKTDSKPPAPPLRLSGVLESFGADRMEIGLSDGGVAVCRFNEATLFAAPRASFRVGDRVEVEARRGGRGSYLALRVTRVERAPPAEAAGGSTPYEAYEPLAEESARRPVLRRRRPGEPERRPLELIEDPDFVPPPIERPMEEPEPPRPPEPPPLHPDPIIAKAMLAAMNFSQSLPNFISRQVMTRYRSRDNGRKWRRIDQVEAEVIYEDGRESYKNIKIDGKPFDGGMKQIGGAWSTGEYGTTLRSLFHPRTQTEFVFRERTQEKGGPAAVYDFHVAKEHSNWDLTSETRSLTAEFGGTVWIDPDSGRTLRIEMEALGLPRGFSLSAVEETIDYSYVTIAGEEYLLPTASENLGCFRGTRQCSRNKLEFRDYRKFSASSSIFHTDSEIDFGGEPSPEAPEQAEPPE